MTLKKRHIPTELTRAQVKRLKGYGLTHPQVAAVLEIPLDQLRQHYGHELEVGLAEMIGAVAKNGIIKPALKGNVLAAMFYLKTQGKWKERDDSEATPVVNIYSASIRENQSIEQFLANHAPRTIELNGAFEERAALEAAKEYAKPPEGEAFEEEE